MNKLYKYLCYLIVLSCSIFLISCSNAGSRATTGPTSITYILANGTVLTIPVNQLNVNVGSSAVTSISAVGGIPGVNILLSSEEIAQNNNLTNQQESNFTVNFNPESLASGSISTSTINITTYNYTVPGTYQAQIKAYYTFDGLQYNQIIGTLDILVSNAETNGESDKNLNISNHGAKIDRAN